MNDQRSIDVKAPLERDALEAQVSADLVRRIGRGDRSAEHEMIERYGRGLLYLLKRRTADAELAKDLRQEAYVVAIEKLRTSSIDDPERLGAYLRGIAVNLVIAEQRKTKRRATSPDLAAIDAASDNRPGPGDSLSRAQLAAVVRTLLDELPVERDREVLVRLYLMDQDRERVCDALGIDASHFNRVLFRAKQRFKALLMQTEKRRNLDVVS